MSDYPIEFSRKIKEDFEAVVPGVQWRPQTTGISKTGKEWALMIPYIDSRQVVDRLNEIVGPGNWSFEWFETGMDETLTVKGKLSIFNRVREDVGYPNSDSDKNPLKSAVSDAIKRCAVQYGIGRFLYKAEPQFVEWNKQKSKPVDKYAFEKLQKLFESN